ncbi:hypothetical protein OF83DRAFT_1149717 [Amylostereum chailletii]|nr:hypothetical protein OF83DRAFT_1149717 [Amylostereum chailletii]
MGLSTRAGHFPPHMHAAPRVYTHPWPWLVVSQRTPSSGGHQGQAEVWWSRSLEGSAG